MLKKTEIISLIITFSLWVSFVLVAIFVPMETKKTEENFVSVKITLPPLPEKQEQKKEAEATTKTPEAEEKQVLEVEKTPAEKAAPETPKVEKVVEETSSKILEKSAEFSSGYYADFKAKHFPLSIVIKARKL